MGTATASSASAARSAGSLFHLPVVAGASIQDAVAAMRQAGLRILAADGGAGCSLDDPDVRARLDEPTAWMFGNEAWGLPPDLVALADEPVAVPIYGKAESLSGAVEEAVEMLHRPGRKIVQNHQSPVLRLALPDLPGAQPRQLSSDAGRSREHPRRADPHRRPN